MRAKIVALVIAIVLATSVQAPAYADGPCRSCVGVIGDSLVYQAGSGEPRIATKLAARGFAAQDIRVDGLVGRPIAGLSSTSSLQVIRAWRADGFDPAVFVIALGTNNKNAKPAVWTAEVGKVLAEIGPGHTVHWVSLGCRDGGDARVASFNTTVAKIAGLRLHDWNTHIHAAPDQKKLWLASDVNGVHMTVPGYELRNAYLAGLP